MKKNSSESTSQNDEKTELIEKKSTEKFQVVGNAFIQRDYSNRESRDLMFEVSKFPPQLDNRIEKENFESAIREINLALAPLNKKNSRNFLESWVSMFTCMLIPTKFDTTSKRLDKLIDSQNKELFIPRGLQILPPKRSGYRNIQIVIFKIPPHPKSLIDKPHVISANAISTMSKRSKSVKTEDTQEIGTMV